MQCGSGGSDGGSSGHSDLTGSSPIVVGDADDVYSALAGDGDHAHSGRRASGASSASCSAAWRNRETSTISYDSSP